MLSQLNQNNDVITYNNTTHPTKQQIVKAYVARDTMSNLSVNSIIDASINKLGYNPNKINRTINYRFNNFYLKNGNNELSKQQMKSNFLNKQEIRNYINNCNNRYQLLISLKSNCTITQVYNCMTISELNYLGW